MLRARQRWLTGFLAAVALAMWIGGLSVAQQTGAASDPAVAAEPAAQPAPRKPRGRLPAYFAALVSPEQREQIYELQAQYNEQIAALQMQIEELAAQRDKEVDAVLTPEQLEEVNQKRAAAAARRNSRRDNPPETPTESP